MYAYGTISAAYVFLGRGGGEEGAGAVEILVSFVLTLKTNICLRIWSVFWTDLTAFFSFVVPAKNKI